MRMMTLYYLFFPRICMCSACSKLPTFSIATQAVLLINIYSRPRILPLRAQTGIKLIKGQYHTDFILESISIFLSILIINCFNMDCNKTSHKQVVWNVSFGSATLKL